MGKYWGSVQLNPLVPGRTLDKARILHTAPDVHETWFIFFSLIFLSAASLRERELSPRSLLCLSRVPAALERLKLSCCVPAAGFQALGYDKEDMHRSHQFLGFFQLHWNQKGPLLRNRQYRNLLDPLPRLCELAKW